MRPNSSLMEQWIVIIVYWAPENLHVHVHKAVNIPGVNVWYGLSARGLVGSFFFEGTVTGEAYLEMLRSSIFTSYTCTLWKQWGLLPTRWGTPTLPPRRVAFPGWKSARTLDRTKRYVWIPTTFTRFNTSGLLPLGDLEVCRVSQETGYFGGPSCIN